MIVRLQHPDESATPYLTVGQDYAVIGIEADDYRVLNDRGEPCLYPPDRFEVVAAEQPADWREETGADGERYAYPPSLNRPGFFEDFFEGKPEAVAEFWRVVNHHLATAEVNGRHPKSRIVKLITSRTMPRSPRKA